MLRRVSSWTEITEASEEFFSALTASLPRAGTMVRIACGGDDAAHQHQRRHAERLPGGDLPRIHPAHAGAQDLGDERRLIGRQRQAGRGDGGQPQADMRQGVVGEHEL